MDVALGQKRRREFGIIIITVLILVVMDVALGRIYFGANK